MADLNINNMKYIAINDFENDLELFDSLAQARTWLENSFNDPEQPYKPEDYDIRIYKLFETIEIKESETSDKWYYKFVPSDEFLNDPTPKAISEFKTYLNSIINIIPDDIHNELWNKLINLINCHYRSLR